MLRITILANPQQVQLKPWPGLVTEAMLVSIEVPPRLLRRLRVFANSVGPIRGVELLLTNSSCVASQMPSVDKGIAISQEVLGMLTTCPGGFL